MASGTSGWTLNETEIEQSRDSAKKLKWIRPAKEILAQADALYLEGKRPEAREQYQLIAGIPLHCPEIPRAKLRLKPRP